MARMASGGRHGFAQSLFQVGGSTGSAIGPLLAAFIVLPRGQGSDRAGSRGVALLAIVLLTNVGAWYRTPSRTGDGAAAGRRIEAAGIAASLAAARRRCSAPWRSCWSLLFSKNIYTASLNSYYTFYLIEKFHVSVQDAQIHLFVFLGAVAAGPSPAARSATGSAASR